MTIALPRLRQKPSIITLADRARDAGDWEAAARLYRKALARNPRNPPIWVQYGHALKESGRLAEAEAAYRRALFFQPKAADSELQLGHVLKLQGRTDAAQAAYLRALALEPSLSEVFSELHGLGWEHRPLKALRRLTQAEDDIDSAWLFEDDDNGNKASAAENTPGVTEPVAIRSEPPTKHALVRDSGLFDAEWYLDQYEDVRRAGLDPVTHYLEVGAFEGRDPSPHFDSDWYLRAYPDVDRAGVNPLVHYLEAGRREGRWPKDNYAEWIRLYDTITDNDRALIKQHIAALPRQPKISVVMPVYETPAEYLRAAIESVRQQLYPFWELCIADDASPSPHVRNILDEYRALDSRIKVTYRAQNGHISACSNSALELATGEFVALLDHDDILPEHALFLVAAMVVEHPELDLLYSDEDKIDANGRRFEPYFKSDWNPDLMLSQNMFSHLGVYRRSLIEEIGGFRIGYEGSQDYDLILRASGRTTPARICHIPHILYHWRAVPGSTALNTEQKSYAPESARRAIRDYLAKRHINAEVIPSANPDYHRVRYKLPRARPLVSLIIPTGGKTHLLSTCLKGMLEETDYDPLEIIILHNNDTRREVFPYLDEVSRDPRVSVVACRSGFNFSRIVNLGVSRAKGDIIGLINDDIEVIEPGWLEEMVSHALRPGVGAVGALLYFPDDRIQHAGVIVGFGGVAGHAHLVRRRGDHGYFGRGILLQNLSCVTAACLVMPKAVYVEVGGFDEKNLAVAFNDVDFCLRIRERGYLIVWTPYAQLYHHESGTRPRDLDPDQRTRFAKEESYMKAYWEDTLKDDPYYNPNLSLGWPNFELAFPPRCNKIWRSNTN
jgi:glycosyltransferase involved in cell wall biosynthesis